MTLVVCQDIPTVGKYQLEVYPGVEQMFLLTDVDLKKATPPPPKKKKSKCYDLVKYYQINLCSNSAHNLLSYLHRFQLFMESQRGLASLQGQTSPRRN